MEFRRQTSQPGNVGEVELDLAVRLLIEVVDVLNRVAVKLNLERAVSNHFFFWR